MRMSLFTALCGAVLFPALSRAQSAADSVGIRAAALDYIDGWYAADGERMERALHPELAKRNVSSDSGGRSRSCPPSYASSDSAWVHPSLGKRNARLHGDRSAIHLDGG